MRKVPWLSRASGGRSRGSSLVRFTRATIISSTSWEEVEVGSSWRDWNEVRQSSYLHRLHTKTYEYAFLNFIHLMYSCNDTLDENSSED